MTLGSAAPPPGVPGARTERAAGPARSTPRFGKVPLGRRLFRDRTSGGPVPRLLMRWISGPLLPAVRLWRRNLQLRVVAGTLLMSIAVVLLLGFVVIGQVRNGLLEAKGKAAQTQAAAWIRRRADERERATGPGGPERGERRRHDGQHLLAHGARRSARQWWYERVQRGGAQCGLRRPRHDQPRPTRLGQRGGVEHPAEAAGRRREGQPAPSRRTHSSGTRTARTRSPGSSSARGSTTSTTTRTSCTTSSRSRRRRSR